MVCPEIIPSAEKCSVRRYTFSLRDEAKAYKRKVRGLWLKFQGGQCSKALPYSAFGSFSAFSLPALAAAIEDQSSPYQRPKLKITDVRTAQVIVHGPQTHVRIYTDAGIYGQGECTDAAVGAASLIRGWRRMLVGRSPLDVEAIWERIRTLGIFAGAQGGQYITALSGVEIALVGSRRQGAGNSRLPAYGRKVSR